MFMLLAKLTLLLTAAWAAHFLLWRSNPRWRLWLWRSTLLATVTLPGLTQLLPDFPLGLPMLRSAAQPTAPLAELTPPNSGVTGADNIAPHIDTQPAKVSSDTPVRPAPAPGTFSARWEVIADTTGVGRPVSLDAVVVCVWTIGATVLLVRMLYSFRRVSRLVGAAREAEESLQISAVRLSAQLGGPRRMKIVVSEKADVPFVAGVLRPVIVLPQRLLSDLTSDHLRMILAHEVAHLAGGDTQWTVAAKVVQCVLWPHPLIWRMPKVHRSVCESVCDGEVARMTSPREAYAQLLAQLALSLHRRTTPDWAVAMFGTSEINQRLRRLAGGLSGERLPRARLTCASATAAMLLCLLASIEVVSASSGEQPMTRGSYASVGGQTDSDGQQPDQAGPSGDAAQAPKVEQPTEATVEAVKRGIQYLIHQQSPNGSFSEQGRSPRVGLTALCTLAILRGQEWAAEGSQDVIIRGVDAIRAKNVNETYDNAFATLLYVELMNRDQFRNMAGTARASIDRAVRLAIDGQKEDGGWGYRPDRQRWTDVTNTACQLRALAAARTAGFEVPEKVIQRGLDCLTALQNKDGGFNYMPSRKMQSSVPRTCTALSALAALGSKDAEAVEAATAYIATRIDDRDNNFHLYGRFFLADWLRTATHPRKHEWTNAIRDRLLETQRSNGEWRGTGFESGQEVLTTAFAALVLISLLPDD